MDQIKKYFSEIGKKGGEKSRRTLTKQQAADTVNVRWAKHRKEKKDEAGN